MTATHGSCNILANGRSVEQAPRRIPVRGFRVPAGHGELREDEASWRGHRAIARRGSRLTGTSAGPSSAPAQVAGAKRCCMTGRAALRLVLSATTSSLVTITERRTCSGCARGITSERLSGKLRQCWPLSGHETLRASASTPASSTRPPPGTPSPTNANTVKSCRFLFVRVWGKSDQRKPLPSQRKRRMVG